MESDGIKGTTEAFCRISRLFYGRSPDCCTFALTDTNGLYGAIRFLDVARESNIKPILGTELTHQSHGAVLLAKIAEGYGNLCRVLSARHDDEPFDFHRDGRSTQGRSGHPLR